MRLQIHHRRIHRLITPPDSSLTAENLSRQIYLENFITRRKARPRGITRRVSDKARHQPGRLHAVAQLTNTHSVITQSQGAGRLHSFRDRGAGVYSKQTGPRDQTEEL